MRIYFFGRPYVAEYEVPLKVKRASALSLLSYLIVHGPSPLTRDAIAFALWPDEPEADARANLRRHLFYLTNDVLPPAPAKTPWIIADKRTIGWNFAAPAWCDVSEFERLVEAGNYAEAVALYRGDLLEGFEDEWVQAPRERLREHQLRLLLDLIDTSRACGAHAAGIGYARQLLTIDPWREDGIRALIELRNLTGDRAGALATYRDFAKRLDAEMGVVPMLQTTQVYERVAQTDSPAAGCEPPTPYRATELTPLRSSTLAPNNLPLEMTTFVAREREIAEVRALIGKHRLVTLIGSGGIGKTRVTLQVAATFLSVLPDGVWFIELAPLASGDYIPSTVAQAMGVTLSVGGDPLDKLVRVLTSKEVMLVFDNCEHLVEAVARVIATLLRGCPLVRVLASSRQGLMVAAEATYRIPTLDVPNATDIPLITAADAPRYAAMSLFVERATTADKRFALTDDNAPAIAEICRRLDGIPLAIELASSRVTILSPRQLRDRLDERFRVLTGGSRDVLPRHRTLRALIDWSHGLLNDRERTLFRRLGIFVNGFSLEGAVAVSSGADLNEHDVFDLLASLVDKSLVLAEPDGDSLRYQLLESTRFYASEKLGEVGEREMLTRKHLLYLRDHFNKLRASEDQTARRAEKEAAFATELEDVRAALDWGITGPDLVAGGELLAEIGPNWSSLGLEIEGISRNEAYLRVLPKRATLVIARLLGALAVLLRDSGHKTQGFEIAAQAVEHAREHGDGQQLANALRDYASLAVILQKLDQAASALRDAEAIPNPSPHRRISLLAVRALLSLNKGDLDAGARAHEQLRKEHRLLGNTRAELTAAFNLAENEHARGNTQRAIAIAREILPTLRARSDRAFLVQLILNLAGYLCAVDDLSGAATAAHEAIALLASREVDQPFVTIAIEQMALIYALQGDVTSAAMLEGYTDAAFQRARIEREFTERTTHDRLTAMLRAMVPQHELALLRVSGAALTADAAVDMVLARDFLGARQ